MVLNLNYVTETCWNEVFKKVQNSIVFIDEPCAESLSWQGGIDKIFKKGARQIKNFSSFESGGDVEKAVFLVSSPVVGPSRIILRDLILNGSFKHCILITSCSPVVLNIATSGNVPENLHEMTAVKKLEMDMLRWMKGQNCAAEIFHFMMSVVPVTDYFFTTPPFRNLFPCMSEDLEGKTIYTTLPRNLDLEALPLELQMGVLHLMTTINSLLSQLAVRESIYCIGLLSSLVGSQLQKHAPSALRFKTSRNNMSLVLIDRSLDLCETLYQKNNVVLDQMKSILDKFPGQSIDVAINMSPITKSKIQNLNAPGCLHDPKSNIFDALITKKNSEIISELQEKIYDVCENQKLLKRLEIDDFNQIIIDNFKSNYNKIRDNLNILQPSLGMIEMMKSDKINNLEIVESLIKFLYQSVSSENGTDTALFQLKEIIIKRKKNGLNIEFILSLIVYFFSIIGQQFEMKENIVKDLQETLSKAIQKDKNMGSLNQHFDTFDKSEVDQFTNKVFNKLNSVRNVRKHLMKYSELAANHGRSQPLEYRSFLSQLLYDILNENKPEIQDLRYKANISVKDNFTSRFSNILLNTAKPHVMDNDIIMFFVIGGVTGQEIKFIKNSFKGTNKEIIVGSTTLLSPAQILENLFFTDPLKPFEI